MNLLKKNIPYRHGEPYPDSHSTMSLQLLTKLASIKYLAFFLHSMEKKSSFLPYRVKKHYSAPEMDTFKDMLPLFYLASLNSRPCTCF